MSSKEDIVDDMVTECMHEGPHIITLGAMPSLIIIEESGSFFQLSSLPKCVNHASIGHYVRGYALLLHHGSGKPCENLLISAEIGELCCTLQHSERFPWLSCLQTCRKHAGLHLAGRNQYQGIS